MPLQNFVDKSLPAVSAAWLNSVDVLKFTIFGDAATKPQARTNLTTDLPLEIANGGTGSRTGVSQVMQGGADTGAVNAYVVTATPAIPAILTAGALIRFTPANTNTGPSTLNAGGSGAVAIIRANGAALTGGELSSSGPTVLQYTGAAWQIVVSAGAQPGYERTALETAAAVIPFSYGRFPSPWKDISRFVSDNTGVTDVSAQFVTALAAEKNIIVPQGTYNLGATGIVLPTSCRFECAGRNNVTFVYTGAGVAIDGFGKNGLAVTDCAIDTTANAAATGMRFGNSAQHILLSNVELRGNLTAGNTGAGLLLDSGSPGAFSGNLLAQLFYTVGYKFGVKFVGNSLGLNTWTSVSFLQSYILGRSAGIIAGSRGLWMDALTNGVGSSFAAGAIESFDTALWVDTGGYGIDVAADLQGNNANFGGGALAGTLGATFAGKVKLTNAVGNDYEASVNGAANRWYQRRQLNGFIDVETYYNQRNTLYDDSTLSAEWSLYRGPTASSYISGTANPTKKFAVVMGSGADAAGGRNFLQLNGQTLHWDTQSPQAAGIGTWAVGDICLNISAALGSPVGWICTVAGSPGTWVALVALGTVSSGWGVPTGNVVQNNYAGASATLPQTSAAVAQIIATLKTYGILAA